MSATWRALITESLERSGETWSDVERIVFNTREIAEWSADADSIPDPSDVTACLDYAFYSGYGGTEGPAFTAWTANRVHFPACYDGAEWATSVPRNPCDEATEHVGGG